MPPHRVYIEPFLGGAAVMRLKRPAALNIGVDLVPSSELPIGDLRDRLSVLPARSAAIDVSCGEDLRPSSSETAYAARALSSGAARLDPLAGPGDGGHRFVFLRGDGLAFLRSYAFRGDELVYCDPPYLHSTRRDLKLYRYELGDRHHRSLLLAIQALPCKVMISGYWSEMYARALAGWRSISYEAMTRAGRVAKEWLWFNFAPPVELHDYRYLGRDFRERERIKRKKNRWTARLSRMPVLERQALLCAIADSGISGEGVLR